MISFKQQDRYDHHRDQRRTYTSTSTSNNNIHKPNFGNKHGKVVLKKSSLGQAVGLRIVVEKSSQVNPIFNNVVVKSAIKIRSRSTKIAASKTSCSKTESSCFLKACHLCDKVLRLDKEVFMYRGDQGFCSRACRNRQIFIDEMQEIEASTKKLLAYRNSRSPKRPCFYLEEDQSPNTNYKHKINRPLISNIHRPHPNRAIFSS